jgi:anti-sigma28 factor (negative regulator of flagellin synthesis)
MVTKTSGDIISAERCASLVRQLREQVTEGSIEIEDAALAADMIECMRERIRLYENLQWDTAS